MWWLLEESRVMGSAKRLGYWLQKRDLVDGFGKKIWERHTILHNKVPCMQHSR